MAKRNGNREARKPKQDKGKKVHATTTASELGPGTAGPNRRR
jgi:hypothetical protein